MTRVITAIIIITGFESFFRLSRVHFAEPSSKRVVRFCELFGVLAAGYTGPDASSPSTVSIAVKSSEIPLVTDHWKCLMMCMCVMWM